jgi:nucleotide-binding universal stress UspA family protein
MQANIPTPSVKFDQILLATDFSRSSKAAFETALDLCRTFSASLFILHIFEYASEISPQMPQVPAEVNNLYRDAEQSLDCLLQSARDRSVPCDGSIVGGLPPQSIIETIDALGIKLVVLGTNANRGLERFIFGSTAEAVLRKAPCPVVVVGPRVRNLDKVAQGGPVVFATDFHSSTVHAVRYAASVCRATGSALHCLTVLPTTVEGGLRSKLIPEVMNQALHHVALESGTEIAPPTCTTVFGPDIPDSVTNYAKTQKASLIVLGVHSAPAIVSHGRWNATCRLIAESPCPVLTVNTSAQKHTGASTDDATEREGLNHSLRASWLRRGTRVA